MLQPGSILRDRYLIQGQLGKGGMGAVYLAFDQNLQMNVAVKENLSPSPEAGRQFRREADFLAKLRHPNLPRVTDHFVLEDKQYLVMDYIEGEDLHSRSSRQLPTVVEVLGWADGLCDALAYLHSRQPPIIHRDIKPSNLKLQADGSVMLVDFGIARTTDQAQTTTGARGLTPGFSPPEQYGGTRTDVRSDQYALAATLYSLLTGRTPPESFERMLNKVELVPIRAINPAVPPHVDEAIGRALSIVADERFPDITEFRGALRGLPVQATVRAAPGTVAAQPAAAAPARGRRSFGLLAGAGVVGLLLIGGGAAVAGGLFRSPEATPTEQPTATTAHIAAVFTETPRPATPTATPTPTTSPTPMPSPTATTVFVGGGGRIAFVSNREDGTTFQIWTMNPDGSDPRQLTAGFGNKSDPAWSPDGRRLVFSAPDFENPANGLDLWAMNPDGSGLFRLWADLGDDTEPAWSPDGGHIAFTSNRIYGARQVWLADVICEPPPGTCTLGDPVNISRLYASAEWSPAWSPDGSELGVLISINEAPGRIFFRPASGGAVEPRRFDISDTLNNIDNLVWSPGGEFLAFDWFRSSTRLHDVFFASATDARSFVNLTRGAGNRDPAYSPDGLWVAFTSNRDQNYEIYLTGGSGGEQTNLTNHPARDQEPAWQPPPFD